MPGERIVDTAVEEEADTIAMSSLMTTTMGQMRQVIEITKERDIRDKFKIVVGGAPVSKKFADNIGAVTLMEDFIGAV